MHSPRSAAPAAAEVHSFIVNTAWPETRQMDELSDQLDQVLNAVTKRFPALTPTQISRAEGAAQAILLCYDSSVFEAARYYPGEPEECDLFAELIASALTVTRFGA